MFNEVEIDEYEDDGFFFSFFLKSIVSAGAILKGSTCWLWNITTEKSGLCQYAVCINQTNAL